jgi:hypothetical protein
MQRVASWCRSSACGMVVTGFDSVSELAVTAVTSLTELCAHWLANSWSSFRCVCTGGGDRARCGGLYVPVCHCVLSQED